VKGRMVHIGSTASLLPAPHQFAYCVAKAGVKMVAEFAAAELVEHGIRSNLVAPMGAVTDLNRDLLADASVMKALESALPSGRLASADEIAAAAVWLCSDDAAYVSGATILHDAAALTRAIWWR
jgi:NAD(P)-dependent dehydrogenase (short-subunit alcohol dehydrogenase family)